LPFYTAQLHAKKQNFHIKNAQQYKYNEDFVVYALFFYEALLKTIQKYTTVVLDNSEKNLCTHTERQQRNCLGE